ncbi:hypothetical protein MMPV_008578 [Pyropia vietnamensis]
MAFPPDLGREPAAAGRAAGAGAPPPSSLLQPPPPTPPASNTATAVGIPAFEGHASVVAAGRVTAHPAVGAAASVGRRCAAATVHDDPADGGDGGTEMAAAPRQASASALMTRTVPLAGSVTTAHPDEDTPPPLGAAATPLAGGATALSSPSGAASLAAARAAPRTTDRLTPPAADTAAPSAPDGAPPRARAGDVAANGSCTGFPAPSSAPLSREEPPPANDRASLPANGEIPSPSARTAPPADPPGSLPPPPVIAYGRPAAGTIKLSSWNINGFKARAKEVLSYVARERPDVLLLQETKLQRPHAPSRHFFLPTYHRAWAFSTAKAGYSGVAIFSLVPPLGVTRGFAATCDGRTDADHPAHGRLLTAEFADVYVVNTYVPNAGEGLVALPYRTSVWDADLAAHLHALAARGKPVLWGGDLNVAAAQVDVAGGIDVRKAGGSPGLTDAERSNFAALLGCTCVADKLERDVQGGEAPRSGCVGAVATATLSGSDPPPLSETKGEAPAAPAAGDAAADGGGATAGLIEDDGVLAGAVMDAAALARHAPDLPAGGEPLSSSPSVAATMSAHEPLDGSHVQAATGTPHPRLPAKRRRDVCTGSAVAPDPPPPSAPHRHCLIDTFRYLYGPVPAVYSFWSMRTAGREVNRGWRIDYWVASGSLVPRLEAAFVRAEVGTSDHCPVGVVLRGVTL